MELDSLSWSHEGKPGSRPPETEIWGEPWMSTSSGRAHGYDCCMCKEFNSI